MNLNLDYRFLTPNQDILNIPLRQEELSAILKKIVPIMERIRNFSTHLIREAFEKSGDNSNSTALIFLFLSIIENYDCLCVHCKNCISRPSLAQLRTIYECYVYIFFITSDPNLKYLRAKSYLFEFHKSTFKRIRITETLLNEQSGINESTQDWVDIVHEYMTEFPSKRYSSLKWYSIFSNKCKNFKELTDYLLKQYPKASFLRFHDFLYSESSRTVHGEDMLDRVSNHKDSIVRLSSFRTFDTKQTFLQNYKRAGQFVCASINIFMSSCLGGDENRFQRELSPLFKDFEEAFASIKFEN